MSERCVTQSTRGYDGCAVLGRTYDNLELLRRPRPLEIVGERWTLLILRDAFFGVTRFGEFADDLGIARNVLQDRLERLVSRGPARARALPGAPAAPRVPC